MFLVTLGMWVKDLGGNLGLKDNDLLSAISPPSDKGGKKGQKRKASSSPDPKPSTPQKDNVVLWKTPNLQQGECFECVCVCVCVCVCY